MKKRIFCVVMAVMMVFMFAACGSNEDGDAAAGWSLQGYFTDEDNNFASITFMEDPDEPGWYVGLMIGEDMMADSYGGIVPEEGTVLKGTIPNGNADKELNITVSREGEKDIMIEVEGGETYHLAPLTVPEASIMVTINTVGRGNIAYEPGEGPVEADPETPYQSAQVNLADPETYTLLAYPEPGFKFVKWTKNGEDYSTEAQFTVLLEETADFVAVFEEDENYAKEKLASLAGEYQCDRAHAILVQTGDNTMGITVEWGGSASTLGKWVMSGEMDVYSNTLFYTDCTMTDITYNENGDVESEELKFKDGAGMIIFNEDGTFTWSDNESGNTDMVFEPMPEGR